MRKAVSLILALTLCMALSIPALAAAVPASEHPDYTEYLTFSKEPIGWYTVGENDNIAPGEFLVVPNGTTFSAKQAYAFSSYYGYGVDKEAFQTGGDGGGEGVGWAYADVEQILGDYYEYYVYGGYIYPRSLYSDPQPGQTEGEDDFWSNQFFNGDDAIVQVHILSESVAKLMNATPANGSSAPATQPATPPAPAATPTVVLSPQKLAVNGETKATEIYNIDNTNYFKLRDLAALLKGTSSQFNVDFDSARNTIVVTTGVSYTTATGHELETGSDKSASAVVSPQSIEIDGKAVELTAYNIGNTNFFGLRALQPYLGYEVDWIAETNTATIATK